MSLFNELKRRNVFRVAIAYLAGAWLLIEVTETLFPIYGFSDAAIRLVVTLLAIGFPILLIFSWVFELTPEGLKLEKDIDRSASVTHHTSKKLDRAIIILLALALGYFSFDKFVLEPARVAELVEETTQQTRSDVLLESYGDKSIAVLPFVNMSPDPDQEYFSDGISEELLNLLSKISDLRVISRSSAFSFKGKDINIPTIAAQLNVAYILEGSVRKAGNQVRITAQLIEARSDTHLWSETYDRELENIFDVQDEISETIVGVLKESLNLQFQTAPQTITATNTEAHDAYLRGRHLVVQRTTATVEAAVREFETAIELDPDYALAHAELAMATALLFRSAYGDLTNTEAVARAAPHAERAMALDPNLAEAHAATGFVLMLQENMGEALISFRRAIQINPNYSITYVWMKYPLQALGYYKESISARETAFRLDPLSKVVISDYVSSLIIRNRLDEADRELEKIASIHPAEYAHWKGVLAADGGRWANRVLGSLDSLRIEPETQHIGTRLAWGFALIGLKQEALTISEPVWPLILRMLGSPGEAVTEAEKRYIEDPVNPESRLDLGLALAAAGDYTRARPILEDMWQRSKGPGPSPGLFSAYEAAPLIAIRRAAGEEAADGELLAAIRGNVHRYGEVEIFGVWWFMSTDYEQGLATYLSGEREKGLALIAKAVESGDFILPKEAYLQILYDDPGFAPILANQEARQLRERNRFLTIVCADNPYEAVWQPAVGTCKTFVETLGN